MAELGRAVCLVWKQRHHGVRGVGRAGGIQRQALRAAGGDLQGVGVRDGVCAVGGAGECVGDVCIRVCNNFHGAGVGDVSEQGIYQDLALSFQLSALSLPGLDHLLVS